MDIMEEGGGIMMRWGREVVIVRVRAVWCGSLKGGRNFVFVSCAGLSLAGDWLNFACPPLLQISNASHAPHSHSRQPNYLRDRHTAKKSSHAKTGRISAVPVVASWSSNFRNHCIAIAHGENTFLELGKIEDRIDRETFVQHS